MITNQRIVGHSSLPSKALSNVAVIGQSQPLSSSPCPWQLSADPWRPPCPCQNALACSHRCAAARSDHPGCALEDAVDADAVAGAHVQVDVSVSDCPNPPCVSAEGAHTAAPGGWVWGPQQG